MRADEWAQLAAALGGAAALALTLAVAARRPEPVPWALFALGALYAAGLRGEALDGWSVAYGTALLLAAELSYAAIGRRRALRAETRVAVRQAAAVAGVAAASALTGLVVVAVAGVEVGSGLPLAAAGAAAAVVLLVSYARLARRG